MQLLKEYRHISIETILANELFKIQSAYEAVKAKFDYPISRNREENDGIFRRVLKIGDGEIVILGDLRGKSKGNYYKMYFEGDMNTFWEMVNSYRKLPNIVEWISSDAIESRISSRYSGLKNYIKRETKDIINDTDLSTIIKNRIMKQDSSTFVKVENVSTGSYEVFISAKAYGDGYTLTGTVYKTEDDVVYSGANCKLRDILIDLMKDYNSIKKILFVIEFD